MAKVAQAIRFDFGDSLKAHMHAYDATKNDFESVNCSQRKLLWSNMQYKIDTSTHRELMQKTAQKWDLQGSVLGRLVWIVLVCFMFFKHSQIVLCFDMVFYYSQIVNLGLRTYPKMRWIIFETAKMFTKSGPLDPSCITKTL